MTKRRCVTMFAILGAAIPAFFFVGTSVYATHYQDYDVRLEANIEALMLMLWPSSIITMANDGAEFGIVSCLVAAAAVLINVIIYSIVGASLWLGSHKHKAFFLFPIALVFLISKIFRVVQ